MDIPSAATTALILAVAEAMLLAFVQQADALGVAVPLAVTLAAFVALRGVQEWRRQLKEKPVAGRYVDNPFWRRVLLPY